MLTKIPKIRTLGLTMLGLVSGLSLSASMLNTATKVNASTSAVIIIKRQTFFKQDYRKQASELPLTDKYEAQQGRRFAFAYIEPDVNQFNGHWKVHFDPPLQPRQGSAKQSWYVFASDVSEIRASGN